MATIPFADPPNKRSDILDRLKVRGSRAKCPAHEDRSTGGSLSVKQVSGKPPLLHCFAGCTFTQIIAALGMRVGDLSAPKPAVNPAHHEWSAQERRAYAHNLWQQSARAEGTLAVRYLRSRGITIPPPPSIRYLALRTHRESGRAFPALVAGIQDQEGRFAGISITWLRADGSGKAPVDPPRKTYGVLRGGAVRLASASERLVVCEGLETGLSIAQACQLPVWCALGASNLPRVVLPREVREVTIAADGDRAGEEAAKAAASRFLREGYRVRIARPEPGLDFNDYLT